MERYRPAHRSVVLIRGACDVDQERHLRLPRCAIVNGSPGSTQRTCVRTGRRLESRVRRSREESRRLYEENERLRALVGLAPADLSRPPMQATLFSTDELLPDVDAHSTMQNKVTFMRTPFRAREDVHAITDQRSAQEDQGYSPAIAGRWSSNTRARRYLRPTDEVLEAHLLGQTTVGVYPLMQGTTPAEVPRGRLRRWHFGPWTPCVPRRLPPSWSGGSAGAIAFGQGGLCLDLLRNGGDGDLRPTPGHRSVAGAMVSRAEMDLASYDRSSRARTSCRREASGT